MLNTKLITWALGIFAAGLLLTVCNLRAGDATKPAHARIS